jgi:uncharacterized spore protein YtfJ
METKAELLLDKVIDQLKEMTKTETIIGEEFTMGEFRCKPVIRIGAGFGSGSGSGEGKGKESGTGGGAGAGIGISPVGFLITKGDEISFIPTDKKRGLSNLLDKLPDLIDKIQDKQEQRDKKNNSSAKEKS